MSAIWTSPRTWATGEIVTAAQLNQHLRDNLEYLKGRPILRVSDLDGTVGNTTSTSFTDITGATGSITTTGGSRLLIIANVTWSINSAANAFVTAVIDGVNQGDSTNGIAYVVSLGANAVTTCFAFLTTAAVSDAAHTVKLQYRTSANTLTCTMFSMVVMEIN